MLTTKHFRSGAFGASLALVLTFAAPAIPNDHGSGAVAFAQGGGSGGGQMGGQDSGQGGQMGGGQMGGGQMGGGMMGGGQMGGGMGQGMGMEPGRGGVEVPGQPACYLPAANVTERRPYNLYRPSCFPGHMQ